MAELEYEVKDEELVDFEGSDYGFGSDEELDVVEEDAAPPDAMEEEGPSLNRPGKEEPESRRGEQLASKAVLPNEPDKKEGAESGEIQDERGEKEEGDVAQPVSSLGSTADKEGYHNEGKVGDSRGRHRKADLEDGELDDAAMPEGSDHEADGNANNDDEDQNDRRDRKRRKDRFAAERLSEDRERKERGSVLIVGGAVRQHRGRGSDRHVDRSGGLSKAGLAGGRGMMPMGGFGQPQNMAAGIMGPGRPLIPLEMGPGIPLRPVGPGFMGPLPGMPLPGAVSMSPFQDALAVHEHMLRSHRMMQQLVQVNAAVGPGPPPMPGPLCAPAMRPIVGLEFGGPLSHGMIHLQPQCPDLATQMAFVGPMDSYPRSPRPSYGSARGVAATGGMFGQGTGRMTSTPRNGIGRQGSLPLVSIPGTATDGHAVGRGRGQERGQVAIPGWGDQQGVATAQAGAPQLGTVQVANNGQSVIKGQATGSGMKGAVPLKIRQNPHGTTVQGNHSQREAIKRTETDGLRKTDEDRSMRNVVKNMRTGSSNLSSVNNGTGSKRERENGLDKNSSLNSSKPHMNNVTLQGTSANPGLTYASNLIQLGGPVQKSRLLTVSGLPENTSMSIVVEAFERQGKVTDFRKEGKGDAFTITFASVPEAISAKRHLHRSVIAGRQITVEYAVHRADS